MTLLIDLFVFLVLLLLVLLLVAVGAAFWLSLPLSNVINRGLRSVGLAGPSPGSRATGVAATGRVVVAFRREPSGEQRGKVFVGGETWDAIAPGSLVPPPEGAPVRVVYNEDLTVTVIDTPVAGDTEP